MIITIDGPTASGKSTVAKLLAQRIGFFHLNSGLLYRGIAYILVHDFHYDPLRLADPAQADLDEIMLKGWLEYDYVNGQARVMYRGQDITPFLKTKDMDNYASISSASYQVRAALLALQQRVASKANVVAEGRDTGTKVFPHAQLKIFLTASLKERAHRWQYFMHHQGKDYSLDQSMQMINERDQRDISRTVAPLMPAADAIIIDSTELSLEEVIAKIAELYSKI